MGHQQLIRSRRDVSGCGSISDGHGPYLVGDSVLDDVVKDVAGAPTSLRAEGSRTVVAGVVALLRELAFDRP
jgi:hypothetical protein